jgi:polyphenol oxidase
MHSWHWQTWNGLPYLTCSVLDAFPHGFFTQQFAPRTPAELVDVIHPTASVHRVWQVHGNTVLTPTEIARSQATPTADDTSPDASAFPPADGLVTEQHAQAVWVCTADCVPVLVADVKTGQVAAVHAGWRGTAAEIVPQAIARLQEQGSQLPHLRVALGPAIAGEVYQVEATVAAQVGATVVKDAIAPSDAAVDQVLQALQELPDPPILADGEPGKARLDVRRVNALQLERLGLTSEQVAIAPYCTYQHTNHFFSYRRSREKKVQWSGIVSINLWD